MEIMRLSQQYAPTLKEDPADAEIASHRLLCSRRHDQESRRWRVHLPALGHARPYQDREYRA